MLTVCRCMSEHPTHASCRGRESPQNWTAERGSAKYEGDAPYAHPCTSSDILLLLDVDEETIGDSASSRRCGDAQRDTRR